jgi:Carboxypeptidase regulatory-like domain/TonB-dependent Receptor Plug Domain/TonB dependent receptor
VRSRTNFADDIIDLRPSKFRRRFSEDYVLKHTLRTIHTFALALMALFVCAGIASAQDATGRIIGNVTDPSGSPVEGAKIRIENIDTHSAEETVSDRDGFYQVLSLKIGNYRVSVEAAGFRTEVFEKQNLQIAQSLRLDAKLQLGQQSESIEVSGQAANVETVNQTVGATVTGEAIQQAPLNGRNVLDLAKLQPGVTETNGDSTAAGTFSIAGGRSDSVTFLLDGGLNNNLLDNSVVFNPNPDTIEEFRILESNYSAEYGRNAGGIISVVTKSGTNNFHGSGFEFVRNDDLNANTFFNKVNGLPRDDLKRNQYGGTIGGPIKKDKLFFFVGYQGQRLSAQTHSGDFTVYTPQQLAGDFSQSGQPGNGQPANCPNADTGVAGFLQANPFFQPNPALAACAMIDPTKFDAVSQKYIAAGLLPASASGSEDFQGSHTNNNNELTIKGDYVINDKNKLTVTLGGLKNPQLLPFQFATVPGFPNSSSNNSYYGNLAYTHTFNANLVNELRLYVQRVNNLQDATATNLPTAADLGIGITPDQPTGPPNILFDNGLSLGFSEQGPTRLVNNTFGFVDTVTWIHGKHNFKMGGGVSAYQNNTVFDFIVNGEFDFFGSATGNSLADFLLGAPTEYFQSPSAPSSIRSKSFNGFLQDEWRITPHLSLNLGVRYEYNSPKYDTEGRSFSVIPGLQSTRFVNAPPGLVFPGDKGAPDGVNFPDKNDWAPRIGFAWDPKGDGKTSIRGGFGVFYDVLKGEDNLQFNGQPPFFGDAGLFFSPNTTAQGGPYQFFTDPFGNASPPSPNPFPSKPPASTIDFGAAGFLPVNASGIVFLVDPHLRTPYTYQYSLSVQHEIVPSTTLEVSYVGSSSHGLTSLIDVNPFVLGTTDRVLNLGAGDSTCIDSGFNSSSGADPSAVCTFAALPEFKNIAKASYNSLQASLTKQVTNSKLGRTYFTLAYTFGHSIDNASGFRQRNSTTPSYDPEGFRASSDQDIRHRITLSGGWDLPFDQMWSSGPKRLTQGWSIFPIITWHTGQPFDVFAQLSDRFDPGAEGPSGAGDPTNIHVNAVGPLNALNPRTSQTFLNPNTGDTSTGNYYFNPTSLSNAQCPDTIAGDPPPPPCTPGPGMLPSNSQVVANPALATYGTLPRNFFRGPSYINFDVTFAKTTSITERLKLEIRADFFNIFNHANFLSPGVTNNGDGTFSGGGDGVNPNADSFGQITSTYDPRIIQLAARFTF